MFSSFFFTDFYWVVDCFWKASLLCGPSGAWTGLGSYRRVLWYNRGGGSSTSPFVRGLDCLFLPPHSASSSQIEWHFGRIPQSMALGFWGILFELRWLMQCADILLNMYGSSILMRGRYHRAEHPNVNIAPCQIRDVFCLGTHGGGADGLNDINPPLCTWCTVDQAQPKIRLLQGTPGGKGGKYVITSWTLSH